MPFRSRPGTFRSRGAFRAAREQNSVKFLAQILGGNVVADVRVRLKYHALGRHLLQAAVENMLFHLEIGYAVAQQSADAVGFLKKRHRVPRAIQLLRSRHSRRS